MPITKKKKIKKAESARLKPREELFCCFYTKNKSLFGNGTKSYAAAYGYDLDSLSREAVYSDDGDEDQEEEDKKFSIPRRRKIEDSEYDKACNTCAVEAARLLRSPKINDRISFLLREMMTDEVADTEMSYVMLQREDLTAKNAALREFNKLKQRTVSKVDLTSNGKEITAITGMEIIKVTQEPKEDTV